MKTENLIEDILVFFDFETTGFSPVKDSIIEIAAIKLSGKTELARFHSIVKPKSKLSAQNSKIHGLTNKTLDKAPIFSAIAPQFLEFIQGTKLIAHNAKFDIAFFQESLVRNGFPPWDGQVFDSLKLFKILYPGLPSYSLLALSKYFGIDNPAKKSHRAMNDVENIVALFLKILEQYESACRNSNIS